MLSFRRYRPLHSLRLLYPRSDMRETSGDGFHRYGWNIGSTFPMVITLRCKAGSWTIWWASLHTQVSIATRKRESEAGSPPTEPGSRGPTIIWPGGGFWRRGVLQPARLGL